MDKYQKPEGSLISFFSNKVKQYGGINLAQGIPGFAPPPELLAILKDISKEPYHQYAPGVGVAELLDWLENNYQKYYPFSRNNFLIVNGATEALSLLYIYLMKLNNGKFNSLGFDPVYESYKYLPTIFDSNCIAFSYESDSSINFAKLEDEIISKNIKLIFVNTPGNPYGKIWKKAEFDCLFKLSEKHNFYIILDAVYKEIYFENKPYMPFEHFNQRLFYVNSFSKKLSITGWRVGYLIAHNQHMQGIQSVHDYTGLSTPTVLQKAIAFYLQKNDGGNNYVSDLRKKLKISADKITKALLELGFKVPTIEGGYFIWAELPKGMNSGFQFAIDLYEQQRVAVIPGEHFSDNYKNYVRFNIAREENEINEAITRLYLFFNLY